MIGALPVGNPSQAPAIRTVRGRAGQSHAQDLAGVRSAVRNRADLRQQLGVDRDAVPGCLLTQGNPPRARQPGLAVSLDGIHQGRTR